MNDKNEASSLKECPYCAELVSSKAKKCKHCGEILDPVLRELEFVKQQRNQNLIFNNNNNNNNGIPSTPVLKKEYPWVGHLFMTIITGGFWLIAWFLFYIFRDKNIYH